MAKIKSVSLGIPQAKEIVRILAKYEETRCHGCADEHFHDTACPARRASEIQTFLRNATNNPTWRHAKYFGVLLDDVRETINILANYGRSICHGCPGEEHQDSCPARNARQLESDLQFLIDHGQR